jgi:nitroimidazol reductase NimA-like FMN-containing flavoprotein (pyridoxamine 5'-phosphate oxidase superfamily)
MKEPMELTVEECLELLNGGVVGRVALATPVGPRIVPLNYAMHDGAIVFRTSPYSELGTYGRNTDLAFEIDQLDFEKHQGWSVVAVGRGALVENAGELQEIRDGWDPTPWAAGQRHLYIKLRWRDLTGRRLGTDWTRDSMMPVRRVL